MNFVILTKEKIFTSDGAFNRPLGRFLIPPGTMCRVSDRTAQVVYLHPVVEGNEHLWAVVGLGDVRALSEMEVVAAAANGQMSDQVWSRCES